MYCKYSIYRATGSSPAGVQNNIDVHECTWKQKEMVISEIMDGSLKMINDIHRFDKRKSFMNLEKPITVQYVLW
jgi:hypothetical protein